MTYADVAELLQVEPGTVSKWARTDASFPLTVFPGRIHRIERAAFDRWCRARGRKNAPSRAQAPSKLAS
jgi:hypothetical protein